MKRAHKSWKFGFLEYRILIRLSYPTKNKSSRIIPQFVINRKAFLFAYLMTASFMLAFFVNNYFNNHAYPTRISPLFENLITSPKPSNGQIIFHGPRNIKKISLSFDADMTPLMKKNLDSGEVKSYFDDKLIDVLRKTKTKATLFLAGMWIEQYPEIAKQLYLNPLFELGNHSYSHPGFDGECYGLTPIPDSKDSEEIGKTQKLLKDITGFDNRLFRFPGGCYSQVDLDMVTKAGAYSIQWDAPGQDGFNDNLENIKSNVINNVQNGSIIVLHMNGEPNEPQTANVLPVIIKTLKDMGFEFVTISELLHIEKPNVLSITNFIKIKNKL